MRTSRVVRAWLAAAVLLCAVPAGSRQHDRTSAAPLASALGGYSGGFSGACLQLRGGGRPKESSEKKTKKRREKKPSRDASDGEEKEKEVAVLQGRVEKRKGKGKEQPIVELGAVAKSKGASSWQHDSDEDVGEEASSESLTEALARQSNVVGEGTMIDDPRTVRQNNRWRDRRMRDAGVLPPAGTGKHPSETGEKSLDKAKAMMAKMGWKQGGGLGLNGTGMTKPIAVTKKGDTAGIGHEKVSRRMEDFRRMKKQAADAWTVTDLPINASWESLDENGKAEDEDSYGFEDANADKVGGGEKEKPASSGSWGVKGRGGEHHFGGEEAEGGGHHPPEKGMPFRRGNMTPAEAARLLESQVRGDVFVHQRHKGAAHSTMLGDKGAKRLNRHTGKYFRKEKQKLKNRPNLGTIDVNYRTPNRITFD